MKVLPWDKMVCPFFFQRLPHCLQGSSLTYCCALLCVHSIFAIRLMREERAGCFALFFFLVSRDCCVTLSHGARGLSAVCNCGIS